MCLVSIYISLLLLQKYHGYKSNLKAHYVSVFHQTLLELCPLKGFGGAIRSMEAEWIGVLYGDVWLRCTFAVKPYAWPWISEKGQGSNIFLFFLVWNSGLPQVNNKTVHHNIQAFLEGVTTISRCRIILWNRDNLQNKSHSAFLITSNYSLHDDQKGLVFVSPSPPLSQPALAWISGPSWGPSLQQGSQYRRLPSLSVGAMPDMPFKAC